MELKDIKQIEREGNVEVENKEDLKKLVEIPCLEACEIFYDNNIRTTWSSGNLAHNEALIDIEYDGLSEENKIIVSRLVKEKKADVQSRTDKYGFVQTSCRFEYPITAKTSIGEISAYFTEIANMFTLQDLSFGFWTRESMSQGYGVSIGNEDFRELATESGLIYEEATGKAWRTDELYQKHLQFIKKKGLGR